MKHRILGSTPDIPVWPPFDPGRFIDFNPTLFRAADGRRYALIRRNAVPPQPGQAGVWAVAVDDALQPAGEPAPIIEQGEDARAVVVGGWLWVLFVQIEFDASGRAAGSTVIMSRHAATPPFAMEGLFEMPKNPSHRVKDGRVTWEKNWVPFVTEHGQLAVIYTHDPWEVLLMDVASGVPRLVRSFLSPGGLRWPYGEVRGGTTPVAWNEEQLITFFHASQVAGSRNVYLVGACRFLNRAPYTPVAMTTEPLFHGAYGHIAARFGWPILASVLFPMGAEADPQRFRVLTGVDDGAVGILDVPRDALDARWEPVSDRPPAPQEPDPALHGDAAADEGAQRLSHYLRLFTVFDGCLLDLHSGPSPLPPAAFLDQFRAVVSRYTPPSHRLMPLWRRSVAQAESTVAPLGELGSLLDHPVALVKLDAQADDLARQVLHNLLITQRPIVLVERCPASGMDDIAALLASRGYLNPPLFNLNPEYQLFCQPAHAQQWPQLLP